ncbi:MAG: PHP domain-containing protein, partial [Acidimicrobiales bacterium]
MIDLHTHSTVSDGSESPGRIVEMAAAAGCRAVALTDHDSLDGLAAAREAAGRVGITVVAGCEVSCRKPAVPGPRPLAGSVHVLVYFVEPGPGPLQEELSALRRDRAERNLRLRARLEELG